MGTPGAAVRSIRPYGSSQQYLYAMKEDLAEWLKELYELDIKVSTFLEVLETGAVLCSHANHITRVAEDFAHACPSAAQHLHLPTAGVSCNPAAQPGTFQARDNISNFIQWCRKEMDINDVLMFETEDLVLRKNEKNFVLCLLELARRAARFGMCAPTLVQMEEEIEEELRQEMELPPADTPPSRPPKKPRDLHNLDQMVQHLVSRCTCPVQFPMIKVSDGKYRVGGSDTLIFVRPTNSSPGPDPPSSRCNMKYGSVQPPQPPAMQTPLCWSAVHRAHCPPSPGHPTATASIPGPTPTPAPARSRGCPRGSLRAGHQHRGHLLEPSPPGMGLHSGHPPHPGAL